MVGYILILLQVYIDSNGMQHVNETRYDEVGLAYSGAQYTWQIFMVESIFHTSRSSADNSAVDGLVYVFLYLVCSVSGP